MPLSKRQRIPARIMLFQLPILLQFGIVRRAGQSGIQNSPQIDKPPEMLDVED